MGNNPELYEQSEGAPQELNRVSGLIQTNRFQLNLLSNNFSSISREIESLKGRIIRLQNNNRHLAQQVLANQQELAQKAQEVQQYLSMIAVRDQEIVELGKDR